MCCHLAATPSQQQHLCFKNQHSQQPMQHYAQQLDMAPPVPPACLQNDVMYNGIRAQGPAASLFFILVIVVGQYMVLNLFLAVLLSNFDDDDEVEGEGGKVKAGSGEAAGADVQDDSAAHWQTVAEDDDGKGAEVRPWNT